MTIAVSKARRGRRAARSSARRPGTPRRRRRPTRRAPGCRRSSSSRRARSRAASWRSRAPSARACSRCAGRSTTRCGSPASSARAGEFALVNSLNPHRDRGTEDRRLRDPRGARPRAGRGRAAVRRRRQLDRVRQRLPRGRAGLPLLLAARGGAAADDARRRRSASPSPARGRGRARSWPPGGRDRDASPTRRSSPRGATSPTRGHLLRALLRRRARRRSRSIALEPGSTVVCILTGHGLKDAARGRRPHRAGLARRAERRGDPRRGRLVNGTIVVRAPASTANLGPGFDCAAAALDLWNELEVAAAVNGEPLVVLDGEGADELPRDDRHLALRAFALVAPLEGRRFRFVNRIPLERGLGSSAATVAAGLVAGRRRSRTHRLPRRAARARAAARGPRRQSRGRAQRRRLPDLAEQRARPRPPARRRPAAGGDRRRPEQAREHEAVALAAARVRAPLGGGRRRRAVGPARRGDRLGRRGAPRRRLPRPPARAVPAPRRAAARRAALPPGRRHGRRDALRLRPVGRRVGRARTRPGGGRRARSAARRRPRAPPRHRRTRNGDADERLLAADRSRQAAQRGAHRRRRPRPARAMLKAVGFTDEDLAKPLVGVATTWIETMPCNLNQRALARHVKQGIRAAGGTPIEFNTVSVSDGVTMGTTGMRGSLISRELIADSIELVVDGPPARRPRLPRRLRQDDPGRGDGARAARRARARLLQRLDRPRAASRTAT